MNISQQDFKNRKSEFFIIDVRELDEEGIIDGAVRIPLGDLMTRIKTLSLPSNKEIVCYCRSGNRSKIAVDFLIKNGFRALNLEGGIKKY
jgi:rhodanese-related sulfurtransferase